MNATINVAFVLALGGCGGGSGGGGKDYCERENLYSDGACDTGCARPDPDCDSTSGDPCTHPTNRYGDGPCDTNCDHPDPDCDSLHDACSNPFNRYGDGPCDTSCRTPDPDCEGLSSDPCLSPDRYGDGPCDTACWSDDPDCDGLPTDPCLSGNRYDNGTCDLDCWRQDIECVVVAPGEITIVWFGATSPFAAGDGAALVLTAAIEPDDTVTLTSAVVDLTTIGGTTQQMVDDGTQGDTTAGDGIYTTGFVVANTLTSGDYDLVLTVTGTDPTTETPATATATITVTIDQKAGVSLADGAAAEPESVLGQEAHDVTFTAHVAATASTIDSVTIDLSSVGGTAGTVMYDDGPVSEGGHEPNGNTAGDGIYAVVHTVPDTIPNDVYDLTVTATGTVDGTLAVSDSTTCLLRVRGVLSVSGEEFLGHGVTPSIWDGSDPLALLEGTGPHQVTARWRVSTSNGATSPTAYLSMGGLGDTSPVFLVDDGPAPGGSEPDGQVAGDGWFHGTFTVPDGHARGEYSLSFLAQADDPSGLLENYAFAHAVVYDRGYDVTEQSATFWSLLGTGTPQTWNDRRVHYTLPFSMPFYGATYDEVAVHQDGTITMDGHHHVMPVPGDALGSVSANMAPFIAAHQYPDMNTYSATTTLLAYEGETPESVKFVTFEWSSVNGTFHNLNFQLVLYEDGRVAVHYGTMKQAYYSELWALMLVDSITDFDEVVTWREAIDRYAQGIDDTRWTFTPRP